MRSRQSPAGTKPAVVIWRCSRAVAEARSSGWRLCCRLTALMGAELRASSWRIFIHVLENPFTLSLLAGVRRGAFSIILVGNQIADSGSGAWADM